MSTPAEHQDWLRRDGYPVPPGGDLLTDAERQLLGKFGHWMKSNDLKPAVGPMELTNLMATLEAVRAEAMAAQQRYTFRRLDVLAKVQPELDAIEAEMTPELKALAERMAGLEAAVKAAVLEYGRTFHHGKVQATHYRGRVTFDNKGLQQYAEVNPEVNRFKKVGQPYVALKYVGAAGDQLPLGGPAEALPPGDE